MINGREVDAILEAARGRTVAVVGDLMLDEWIIGTASRISPEAPVPVVRFAERRTALGGAANVAMNLLRLGARVRVCGVIGTDEAGAELARELQEAGADVNRLVRDAARPTTLKTRIMAQSQQQSQQMLRVDRESEEPLSSALQDQLCEQLSSLLEGAAAVCISDYDKGLATCGLVTSVIEQARRGGLCVAAGPKPHNLSGFTHADFLSLNHKEASEASGLKLETDDAIRRAGSLLCERTQVAALAITHGARGVTLFQKDEPPRHIMEHTVEVFDGTGAGDTFLAATSLALVAGADFFQATELGNLAAAASVRHVGVVAVTPDEVRHVAAE